MARWFGKSRSSGEMGASPRVSLQAMGPVTPEFMLALRAKASDGDTAAAVTLAQVLRSADIEELTSRAQAGDGEDAYLLALALNAQGAKKNATRWLRTAAEREVPDAAYDMAVRTLGDDARRNFGKAEPWLRRAAQGGHGPAAAMLGMTLARLGSQHWPEAERYLAAAANADHADCANALGSLRLEQEDEAGAEQWFKKAARKGDPDGANNYAVLLYRRDGDVREVMRWLKVAADRGHIGAAENLRKMGATRQDG